MTSSRTQAPGQPNWFGALSPTYDGPSSWLWLVGVARIATLLLIAVGSYRALDPAIGYRWLLSIIYAAALASSIWYLVALRKERSISPVLTWTQMLVDFGVVAATIIFTDGQHSFFTFLIVVVILEAGVLLGLMQGFVFATLASCYMALLAAQSMAVTADVLSHWYDVLIKGIVFFFTAFISGYWNQRLSRLKHFQREILDNMSSGFLITDEKGLVIGVNKAGCAILNLHEPSVAGLHVEGIMRPESGAECPVTTALRHKKDFTSYEFHAQTSDGASKLLGLTTSRIHDAHGHVTGLIASFSDLTEMARMRVELQQQDRMSVIGELSAGLAHEIRNPIASIRSAVEELKSNPDTPAIAARLAGIAVRESDHLNEIVGGFLDFAREPRRRYGNVDLPALLTGVREQLAWKFGGDGLEVRLDIPEGAAPAIIGDATQLKQVFMNLGQNAIEAMTGRGLLGITLLYPEHGPVEVRFDDEGPGIAPDKIARVFEPFYTEKEGGVGMGLAVCMRLITAHDGTLQAMPRAGGGTSMRVRLPRRPHGVEEPHV